MIKTNGKEHNNNGHRQSSEINNDVDNNAHSREQAHVETRHRSVHDQDNHIHAEHVQHGQQSTADQTNRSNKMKNKTKNNMQSVLNNTLSAIVFLFIIIIGSQSIVEAKSININIERIAIEQIDNDSIENDRINNRIGRIDRISDLVSSIDRNIIENRIPNRIESDIDSNQQIIERIPADVKIESRISRVNTLKDIDVIINDRIQDRIVRGEIVIEKNIR